VYVNGGTNDIGFTNVCMMLFGNLFSRLRITSVFEGFIKEGLFALGSICYE